MSSGSISDTSPDDAGQQFIGGRRCRGSSPTTVTVTNPSTGEVLATDALAAPADVDAAVAAATAAFPGWSGATPAERSTLLHRLAAELDAVAGELARAESRQCGKPIRLAEGFDVPGTVDNVAFFAGAARNLEGRASRRVLRRPHSSIRREPIGVVGSIAPWNYPLQMAGVEDPSGDRRRQHDRAQALRAHPADLPGVRRGGAAGRASPTAWSTS